MPFKKIKGIIIHSLNEGKLLVRLFEEKKVPDLGENIEITEGIRGVVLDVLGPVKTPYILIKRNEK